jgi:hypothetical protein
MGYKPSLKNSGSPESFWDSAKVYSINQIKPKFLDSDPHQNHLFQEGEKNHRPSCRNQLHGAPVDKKEWLGWD